MNGNEKTLIQQLLDNDVEWKKESRADIRGLQTSVDKLTNQTGALTQAFFDSKDFYNERMNGCTNRFETLEKNQGRIVKYGSAAYLIILSIITGTRFI